MRHQLAFKIVLGICALVYLLSAKGYIEVSDTSFSLETAEALLTRGRLDIPVAKEYTRTGRDGLSYSKYGIGLALYYLPIVAVGDRVAHITRRPASEVSGFLISFANIPFALIALICLQRILRILGVDGLWASWIPFGMALGTLMWRYAVYDFSEEMQLCLLTLAFCCCLEGTRRFLIGAGVALAMLMLVKVVYIIVVPIFLFYVLARTSRGDRRWRSLLLVALPVLLACAFLAGLNFYRFGNVFESGYGQEAGKFYLGQLPYAVPRLLGSLDKGLFVFCPILMFGALGWKEFVHKHKWEAATCAALLLCNLLLGASWYSWGGGLAWGPRLLVPAIPLWMLPSAFFLQRRRRAFAWVFGIVTVISVVTQIPGVLVKNQEIYNIKEYSLTSEERVHASSDYASAYILLWHKLTAGDEIYSTGEFGAPGSRTIDMSQNRSVLGLNVWTEHVARQVGLPFLRWVPLIVVAILLSAGFGVVTVRLRATRLTSGLVTMQAVDGS